MVKKRNRITPEMSKTIAETSPLIKKITSKIDENEINNIINIPINLLETNPYQPRIDINIQSLNELISSIEQNGLLQPIVITEKNENGKHFIIAGHRRYEAFKIMGKDKIKATIIKNIKDKDLAILSLTENLMRESLHPIENAIAIKNILDEGIVESQNKLAEYVGLSKGYVSKMLSILKLPSSIIKEIKKDNYKDINILILLNKLDNEKTMLEAYKSIKHLPRYDAQKHLKIKYFKKKEKIYEMLTVEKKKSKININIDIKNLDKNILEKIESKINELKSYIKIVVEEENNAEK